MNHFLKRACLLLLLLTQLSACVREEYLPNTPEGNFEALWKIINEQYCFLEYKEIDWDGIYLKYVDKITPDMDELDLFYTLGEMLNELKDGHVNLISDNNFFNYDGWLVGYPRNFNEYVQENYLGDNYLEKDPAKYKIIHPQGIGYLYIPNFSTTLDYNDLKRIFNYFVNCQGVIIDVRENGGGSLVNASRLASCFTPQKVLTGYVRHKTGRGRSDFSSPRAIYLEPAEGIYWDKAAVVLTSRHVYSAANSFVNEMKNLPNVTVIGDITGGGSGLPFSSELPNGWRVRYSASPHFDINMEHIEFGIPPHIEVDLDKDDEKKGIDTLIEKAMILLSQEESE
ncbi:MAG: S41 family peptidase [Bacteroides sp.]|nr:S41 family peptidase [Bacteroides sp.]